MAALATVATVATIGAAVVGAGASVISAYSTYQQGEAQKAELNRQAAIDEKSGTAEFAASQREAEQRRLEGQLVMSRAQAYAAASGAGAGSDDPTISKILSDTGERAKFGSDSVLYQGQARRDDYFAEAAAKRTTGQNNFFGSILRSAGTLLGGVGHLAETSDQWMPSSSSGSRAIPGGVAMTGGVY